MFANEPSAASLPKEVKEAQKSLADWMKGFLEKSRKDVEKQLGNKAEEATWEFEGKDELLLRYKTSDQGKLELYFFGDQVVNVSYHLLAN